MPLAVRQLALFQPVRRSPTTRRHARHEKRSLKAVNPIASSAATADLPASLKTLVGQFQAVADPMQRYKQLLFFATKLEPLPADAHTQENKVKGCVSQVWVVPSLAEDGKIYWKADSDSQLTKGLAALLVQGLSGCTPDEIVRIPPTFIELLGLQQSLTPSRNNGFLNMFKLMQKKALDIYLKEQQVAGATASDSNGEVEFAGSDSDGGNGDKAAGSRNSDEGAAGSGASATSSSSSSTPVADSMRSKLTQELQPLKLDIVDDSYKHAGHSGFRGKAGYSGETHFVVEIVSPKFEGLTSIKRHRLVYKIIDEEMGNPVHALSLITKTPQEAGIA